MIKVKLSEIVANVDNIRQLQEIKLPVKIAYRIMRLANKVQPMLEVYSEKRNALIKELGAENPDKTFSIPPTDTEKMKEFATKLTDLLSIEEEIEWFTPIKLSELGEIVIPAKNLVNFMFEE